MVSRAAKSDTRAIEKGASDNHEPAIRFKPDYAYHYREVVKFDLLADWKPC